MRQRVNTKVRGTIIYESPGKTVQLYRHVWVPKLEGKKLVTYSLRQQKNGTRTARFRLVKALTYPYAFDITYQEEK
jgi:pullulanase/glycogen debranching enzyme